jgi:bacterioferritin-associated ferredoxin
MNLRATLLCRCEDVSVAEVDAAVRAGARTMRDIKLRTRVGMGACQGRVCHAALDRLVEHPEAGRLPVRPPARLVSLARLQKGARDR